MNRGRLLGWGLLLTMAGAPVFAGPFQDPDGPAQAETATEPLPAAGGAGAPETVVAPDSNGAGPAAEAPAETRWEDPDRLAQLANQPVRPMTEGPLHEAFLSPRKDRNPIHVATAPPTPISERPAVDPPSASAQWIEGYWEWDAGRKDYVWVTGTWRVPPPGRFWVNGYWKRDQDGWYRVPGFWSDRKTDRLDYRKNGPPQGPSRRRARVSRRLPIVSTSPASSTPTATAWSGRRGSGPRCSPAGRGFRPSGSASPKAGPSRTATGIAPSRIAALSSPRLRSTNPPRPPTT